MLFLELSKLKMMFKVERPFLLPIFFAILPVVSVFSSNALVPLTIILAGTLFIHDYAKYKYVPRPTKTTFCCGFLFFSWIMFSYFWSINPESGLLLSFRLLGLSICGWVLVHSVDRRTQDEKDKIRKFLLLGFVLGAVCLLIESQFSAPITKIFKGVAYDTNLNLSRFNRGTTFIACVGWFLIALYIDKVDKKISAFVFFMILLLLIVGFAHSGSTMIGVTLGAFWVLVAVIFSRFSRLLLITFTCIGILTMPLIASQTKVFGTPENEYNVYHSAHHRFYIWGFVADQILKSPLTGFGMDASRVYPNASEDIYKRMRTAKEGGGTVIVEGRVISLHPHNGPLQVWLELGIIGAVLVMICTINILMWSWKYLNKSRLQDGALQAAIVTSLIVTVLGYGVWQNKWFVMFFLFSAIATLLPGRKATGELKERLNLK